jgi:hypothetical protein
MQFVEFCVVCIDETSTGASTTSMVTGRISALGGW